MAKEKPDVNNWPMDRRVVRIVAALNAIPGVTTYGSCGGHRKPHADWGQISEGRFEVSLDVAQTAKGWRALDVITYAAQESGDGLVTLSTWHNGGSLTFSLEGRGGIHPDVIAEALTAANKEAK